jgi:hypothetical protein
MEARDAEAGKVRSRECEKQKKKNRKKWGGLEFVKHLLCVCLCNNIILLKTSTANNT